MPPQKILNTLLVVLLLLIVIALVLGSILLLLLKEFIWSSIYPSLSSLPCFWSCL
jgi:hypothetical protein